MEFAQQKRIYHIIIVLKMKRSNNSCSIKEKYTTIYHAQFEISKLKALNPEKNFSFYKCPKCKNYHLREII